MILRAGLNGADRLLYGLVGVLLLVAAGFTTVGTAVDLVRGSGSRAISDAGFFVLERVLLLFIFAELLYTLRLVEADGRILVEPFLFIGLIAVVRRVLVVTAESEFNDGLHRVEEFAIEIGALAVLALVLVVAIRLLRAGQGRPP
jgi:uncharacterized membrane protein (DUF373 family)